MYEQAQVDSAGKVDRGPRRVLLIGQSTRKHAEEGIERQPCSRVHVDRTSSLTDDRSRPWNITLWSRRRSADGSPIGEWERCCGRLDRGVLDGGDSRPIDVIRAQPVRFTRPLGGPHAIDRTFRQFGRDGTGRAGDHRRNQVGVLGFDILEVGGAVDAEQPGDLGVGERRHERDTPTEGSSGNAQRTERMTHVMLTITVGTLAVFPSLAPMHRREADKEGACG